MENNVNINEFIKNYDNKNIDCNYNNNDDIYYSDYISRYEEI